MLNASRAYRSPPLRYKNVHVSLKPLTKVAPSPFPALYLMPTPCDLRVYASNIQSLILLLRQKGSFRGSTCCSDWCYQLCKRAHYKMVSALPTFSDRQWGLGVTSLNTLIKTCGEGALVVYSSFLGCLVGCCPARFSRCIN